MDQNELQRDIEELRDALMDYYGTAMQENPMSVIDLSEVERMSDLQVLEEAERLGL